MPSRLAAPSTPNPSIPAAVPASPGEAALALAAASRALWLATLALMTAFMQTRAPAHRLLLARRIARNFETLAQQDCFDASARASFARLQLRWQGHAAQCDAKPAPIFGSLLRLLS